MRTNVVYQGDCIQGLKKMPDKSVDLILTDPPYNVGKNIENDNLTEIDYLSFMNKIINELYRICKDNGSLYIFCSHKFMGRLDCFLQEVGFNVKSRIIWVKRSGSRGTKRGYIPEYEPILFAVKGNEFVFNEDSVRVEYSESSKNRKDSYNKKKEYYWKPNPLGKLCPDVWLDIGQLHFAHPERIISNGDTVIETQKPLELIRRIINASSNENDIVLDPFMGSGTTAVACKQLNRRWVGFEISPEYCKIIAKRLSQKTMAGFFGTSPDGDPAGALNKDFTENLRVFPNRQQPIDERKLPTS